MESYSESYQWPPKLQTYSYSESYQWPSKLQTHEYVWNFSLAQLRDCRNNIFESPCVYTDENELEWGLRLKACNCWRRTLIRNYFSISGSHPNCGGMELQLVNNINETEFDVDTKPYAYGGEVTFCVNLSNKETKTEKQTFTLMKGIVVKCIPNINGPITTDFVVKCEITLCKLSDAIPLFISQNLENIIPFEVNASNPLEDFGKLYLNENHSDVKICIKSKDGQSKEYPAHKLILTARSEVFEAMFRHEMQEKKLDRVVVEDIENEVFLEALRYIYTGNVRNLDTLANQILAVADKYQLEKLKITCGNVLRKKLSVETAKDIVILADMYNVGDLKEKAIQFIKDHSAGVLEKLDSDAWNELMSKPHLMKDLLIAKMN